MTSLIKKFLHVEEKTGTASVPTGAVTNLTSVDVSDENAWYLLIGAVIPSSSSAGKVLQARWGYAGVNTRSETISQSIAVQSVALVKGNGGTTSFATYHNVGSAFSVSYKAWAIKL